MIAARWPTPIAIAHRGSRYLWPENTMEAFSGAVALGVEHIETDLRMTKDGVLVCFHDHTVDRTTGASGRIDEMTYEEVASLDAGNRHAAQAEFPFRGRGIGVPRFEELITSFPSIRVVVDLKADEMAEELARTIERHSLHDRLIIGSFKDNRLGAFRKATGGRVATSSGSAETKRWLIAARVGRTVPGPARALQIPTHARGMRVVDDRLVRSAHSAGLQVHVWTVNRAEEMQGLLDMGVDGIVTDRPDVLWSLMRERRNQPEC